MGIIQRTARIMFGRISSSLQDFGGGVATDIERVFRENNITVTSVSNQRATPRKISFDFGGEKDGMEVRAGHFSSHFSELSGLIKPGTILINGWLARPGQNAYDEPLEKFEIRI